MIFIPRAPIYLLDRFFLREKYYAIFIDRSQHSNIIDKEKSVTRSWWHDDGEEGALIMQTEQKVERYV